MLPRLLYIISIFFLGLDLVRLDFLQDALAHNAARDLSAVLQGDGSDDGVNRTAHDGLDT